MKYYSLYFGQAYGTGAYGSGSYSCTTEQQQAGTCTAASGSTNSGSSNSGLTNTGIAVATIVTLACLIVFISLIVRIWRRKPVLQSVETQASDDQQVSPRSDQNQ